MAAFLGLFAFASAAPQARQSAPELSLSNKLRLAENAAERYALLPNDKDFFFDFNQLPFANSQTSPALTGTHVSLTVVDVPPCAMAAVHLHPRATELFVVTSGHIITEMIPESFILPDGKQRVIRNDLRNNTMAIFPMGAYHTSINPECEPASTVVIFNSEDSGFVNVASQLFSLTNTTIADTTGLAIVGEDIEAIRAAIPPGAIVTVNECLAACGLDRPRL
ncbi:spherulin [Stachybotrys elegans]|uniref:Spherulin n=1 Tax=Stachybotrys elegans TaxID=80388 RepID=A0A8K0WTY6_9HYPO|nr:spherulin [Stachybotrys elegans]